MAQAADERTDEQLMSAYAAGDRAAFQTLFDRYAALLFGMARRRLSSEDDARDVVQQTLLQLHRARHDYRQGAPFRPWLFTIALNLVREQYRKRKRRNEQGLEGSDAPPEAASPPEAETRDEQKARAARVRAALASLPEQQREVIELHWFEESPYEEIAKILGASVAAVRVRAHRGYERLRQILPDLGNNS